MSDVMPQAENTAPPSSKPAPAASLSSIDIPLRRPEPRIPASAPKATTADRATPTPLNDDEPQKKPRQFPSARRQPTPPAIAANEDLPPVIDAADLPPEQPAHDAAVAPAAVIDLWEHLAANRLRPKLSDMDAVTIARQWPNSLLLRVTEDGRRPALEVAHMFAPTAGGPTIALPIDAMTVDWIVALGREVVSTRAPIHETDAVPTGRGAINCGVIALPFGPESRVDHVLCHLYRVDENTIEGEATVEDRLPPRDRSGIKRLFGR